MHEVTHSHSDSRRLKPLGAKDQANDSVSVARVRNSGNGQRWILCDPSNCGHISGTGNRGMPQVARSLRSCKAEWGVGITCVNRFIQRWPDCPKIGKIASLKKVPFRNRPLFDMLSVSGSAVRTEFSLQICATASRFLSSLLALCCRAVAV